MQGFEKLFLRAIAQRRETGPVKMPRNLLDRLQAKPVGFPIRRHVFETIAIVRVIEEPFVDLRQNRDACALVAIVLRQDVTANGFHQRLLLGVEEANRRHILDPVEDHLTRLRVPELLLVERAETRIIARLRPVSLLLPAQQTREQTQKPASGEQQRRKQRRSVDDVIKRFAQPARAPQNAARVINTAHAAIDASPVRRGRAARCAPRDGS